MSFFDKFATKSQKLNHYGKCREKAKAIIGDCRRSNGRHIPRVTSPPKYQAHNTISRVPSGAAIGASPPTKSLSNYITTATPPQRPLMVLPVCASPASKTATTYYTLPGIEVTQPMQGIYIKRETLSNGNVRVSKIAIR